MPVEIMSLVCLSSFFLRIVLFRFFAVSFSSFPVQFKFLLEKDHPRDEKGDGKTQTQFPIVYKPVHANIRLVFEPGFAPPFFCSLMAAKLPLLRLRSTATS